MKEKIENFSAGCDVQNLLTKILAEMKNPEDIYEAMLDSRLIKDQNMKMSAQLGLTIITFCHAGGQVIFKDWDDNI